MHWVWVILGALAVVAVGVGAGLLVESILKRRERPSSRVSIAIIASITIVLAIGQGVLQLEIEATAPQANPVTAPSGLSATVSPMPTASNSGNWYGYGPERTTYTDEHPADHPVLNSIIDNGDIGDERNYLRIKLEGPVGSVAPDYGKLVAVTPGNTIDVEVSVFNDAADNVGDAGTIHGLSAQLLVRQTGTQVPIEVRLRGTNVPAIWDSSGVLAAFPVKLEWVTGSAVFRNVFGDIPVPDEMADGKKQLLGSEYLDGEYRIGYGGPKNLELGSGYLTFQLRVVAAADTPQIGSPS